MKIKSSPKIFYHWLQANHKRFHHAPWIVKMGEEDLYFQFNGVTPMIQGYLNESGTFEIAVEFRGECWDIIADFELYLSSNSNGQYYCSECKYLYEHDFSRKRPMLYNSIQELWIEHSFKPLLQWANENLQACCRLCLGGGEGKGTWAEIKRQDNIKVEECFLILPVII